MLLSILFIWVLYGTSPLLSPSLFKKFQLYSSPNANPVFDISSSNQGKVTDTQESNSLLSMINMIQEISSSKSMRFRQSSEKLQEKFAKLFATRYDITKERLLQAINVTSKLETIPNHPYSLSYIANINAQLKSVENVPKSILFYNEPLLNLDNITYPFVFPIETMESINISNISSVLPLKSAAAVVQPSLVQPSTPNDVGNNMTLREKRLNIQNMFNRLNILSTESRRQNDELLFISRLKLGLRLESLKWRLGKKLFSYLLRDTEFMIDSPTNYTVVMSDGMSKPSLQALKGIDYQYENFTIDNLSHREVSPTSMKMLSKKWHAAMAVLESVPALSPIMSSDKPAIDYGVNYPLLFHSAMIMTQATYNLRLSPILNDPTPVIVQKLGVIIEDIFRIEGTYENSQFHFVKNMSEEEYLDNVKKATLSMDMKKILQEVLSSFNQTSQNLQLVEDDTKRSVELARHALGCSSDVNQNNLSIHVIQSDKACAIVTYDKHINLITIAFRGTKDPIDIITDVSFIPKSINFDENRGVNDDIKAHSGFLNAFESLKYELDDILSSISHVTPNHKPKLLLVGHSMGGAIAQIASGYYSAYQPYLITISAPATGNKAFCSYIEQHVLPIGGGIRLWNEFDIVPYLALFVGYEHVGLPIKMKLSNAAKALFREEVELSNPVFEHYPTSLDAVLPHVLFHMGEIVYVFPILGVDLMK